MMAVLVATLALNVTTTDGEPLRLVADGTGDETVYWVVDGRPQGSTHAGELLVVGTAPGEHRIAAQTGWMGAWSVFARAQPDVEVWAHAPTAVARGAGLDRPVPGLSIPGAVIALCVAVAAAHRLLPKTP